MGKLYESERVDFQIVERRSKSENVLCRLRYPFMRSDWKNGNGRIYPRKIVEREVMKYKESILETRGLGMLEHPANGSQTSLDRISHTVDNVWFDESASLATAESSVLKTTKGKDLFILLNEGIPLGASTRGVGTTTKTLEGDIVNEDFRLISIDIVSGPSFGKETAITKANIFESFNAVADSTLSLFQYHESLDAGQQWSYEEFLESLSLKSLDERRFDRERVLAGFKTICEQTRRK